MDIQNLVSRFIWLIMNIITGYVVYFLLRKQIGINASVIIGIICALLIYAHPLPLLYLTWKYYLPKETLTQYIYNFGLPYDVGKDQVIWKNMAGFDETWILDEQIKHSHPMDHIDFVYSSIQVPGIKPEHVCIIAHATGSIFIDLLKQKATARCHYLVKNAVSLGFVQDVVAGKISKSDARAVYADRILNNKYPSWFKDPLDEAHKTLGEGAHHLLITGKTHEHFM